MVKGVHVLSKLFLRYPILSGDFLDYAKLDIKAASNLVFIQLVFFMTGTAFVAGTGAGMTGTSYFVYYKTLFMMLPIIATFSWLFVMPKSIAQAAVRTLKKNKSILAYFVFAFLSIPMAYDRSFSLLRLVITLSSFVSMFCIIVQYDALLGRYARRFFFRHLVYVYTLSLALPFYIMSQTGMGAFLGAFRSYLHGMGIIHPNILAAFYAYGFIHAIYFTDPERIQRLPLNKIETFMRSILVFAMLILFVALFSRTVVFAVFIAFIVALIFAVFLHGNRIALLVLSVVGFLGAIVAGIIFSGALNIEELMPYISRGLEVEQLLTFTNRTVLWATLLEQMTIKIFMVGNGYGVMVAGYGVDFGSGILYGAHSSYLSLLLSTGIFSLLAFIIYLLAAYVRVWYMSTALGLRSTLLNITILTLFVQHNFNSTQFSLNFSITFALLVLFQSLSLDPKLSLINEDDNEKARRVVS